MPPENVELVELAPMVEIVEMVEMVPVTLVVLDEKVSDDLDAYHQSFLGVVL